MPYALRSGQPGCPGWAVVNTTTGKTVPGGCHPDRAAAARHLKALKADVPAQDLGLTVSYTDAPGGTMRIGAAELARLNEALDAIAAASNPDKNRGNAETLRRYWAEGEGAAQIRWGQEGDFGRCQRLVVEHGHMSPEQAAGYCNLLHKRALGFYPATHKKMMKGAAGDGPAAAYSPSQPRVPAGSSAGGQFAPASTSAAPTNEKPVGEGETGKRVSDLQKRLSELGYKVDPDGKFGPKTLAAVKAFQKAKGLKVDGLVGPLTTAALRGKPAAGKTPAKKKSPAGKPARAAAGEPPGLPQLVTIPGVDILAAGTWQLSTGRQTFTRDDLAAAVEAAKCPAVGNPVIKIGHLDQRFTPAPQASETDGEPAIGRVANLRLNEGGTKIVGDLAGMPGWLGAIAASAYPRRSVEGKFRFACQIGHQHPFVLTGLALLGVTPPGVGVLNGLDDVASLYGLTASAGEAWRTEPQDQEEPVMPVTEEDVRRAYYATASPPQSWWITELQMAPTQLIVADEGTGKLYRVPFTIESDAVEFGSPDEMASYDDVAASRGTGPVMVYASAGDSRSVMAAWDGAAAVRAMGDDPSASAIKAMFALPGDTKTDSSLPHHDCSGGKVGAANPDACSAAIAALNGARGGLKGVSEGQKRAAYSHLAAHLKAAGRTPPDFTGSAPEDGDEDEGAFIEAAGNHGPHTGEHTHPHSAMGDQGGDATHEHAHRHDNDAVHDHAHAPVSAAPAASKEGVRTVDFTDEQLAAIRAKLGKQPGEEVTPADIAAAFAAPAAPVAASAAGGETVEVPAITEGTYLVDGDILKQYQERALAGDRAVHAMAVAERDTVLAAAVSDGKFAQARLDHFRRLWDRDPDGTRKLVGSLASGLVPMNPVGSAGEFGVDPDLPGDFAGQDAYRKLYPDDLKGGSSPAPGVRAGRGF